MFLLNIKMKSEIFKAVQYLRSGGVILYPCDTIWAMGCDATNQDAINKIYNLKKRNISSPLICLMSDFKMAKRYLSITNKIKNYINSQEKPTTIIYDSVENLRTYKNSIAVRIPNDTFCRKLILELDKPITSTSVNFSGKSYPEYFKDIEPDIVNKVDYAVNLKRDVKLQEPSKIVKIENDVFITLRD